MGKRLDQATVSAARRLIDRAEAGGAALVLFDTADRVVFANQRNRDLFPFADFDLAPTYELFFFDNLKYRTFVESEVYERPDYWLAACQRYRRITVFGQFLKTYPDGAVYLVTHEILPGIGSYFSRVRVQGGPPAAPDQPPAAALGTLSLPALPWPSRRIFEQVAEAAAVVARDGLILEINARMRRLLGPAGCFSDAGGRLAAVVPDDHRRLLRALAAAEDGADTLIRLTRPVGDLPYLAAVEPCAMPAGLQPLITVMVIDPEEIPAVPPEALIALFGLTPAEARVAAAIGRGEELAAIAGRAGTRYQTVRAQLRSVFQKTGLKRQAELVGLCIRLAAAVRRPGPGN